MALIFSQSMRNLMIGRGLLANFASPCSISIYTGIQPTTNDVISNWSAYNSGTSGFLIHYTGATWTQPSSGILMQLTTFPAAGFPVNTGTATWCILWATAITGANVAATTLPSNNFLIGPCSDSVGLGVIRFANPNLSTAASAVILDGSVGATF